MGISYKEAGVDIAAGNKAVELMKKEVESTFTSGVINNPGGFGGLFKPGFQTFKEPVLVSGTDGVGTKLKLAFELDIHDTIGIDLVAMSVNDILVQGASPLFFLDYLATGKIEPGKVAEIVKGIAAGCREAGAALLGGETAEMAGFYNAGEYDLAGFAVGITDQTNLITGENIEAGDKLIGLASSGVHSNGFTLVRKALFEIAGYSYQEKLTGLDQKLGLELLKPTRIYVKTILSLLDEFKLKGMAHITGGGILENLPRILPDNLKAVIKNQSWEIPEVFKIIQEAGSIAEQEMYRTFNMGIGFILVVDASDQSGIIKLLDELEEEYYLIGEIVEGENSSLEFV
ncbi:MAG: phosphoribosylformylglycinamidine cyclo-ligase [Halanaerobiaceae bacterium]